MTWEIREGDVLDRLREMPDGSINTCITSPPYWGLRDYGTASWVGGDAECDHAPDISESEMVRNDAGDAFRNSKRYRDNSSSSAYVSLCGKCGANRVDKQLGLEATPEEYIENMVEVFREVKRVLRDDATLWVNMGDSYLSQQGKGFNGQKRLDDDSRNNPVKRPAHIKPKDLAGMPWTLALALRDDGWYLRSDIIWCLSGGTYLYARTQKGDMPMMIKDLDRLDPSTVKLWNGSKWTQLLGMNRNERKGDELELLLRSGERISCTPTHRFPTNRGLLQASEIQEGDELSTRKLAEPETPRDCFIDEDAAWFAGLYLAEGSMSEDTIQIAGHTKETERWERIKRVAAKFGGSATKTDTGNCQYIRVYGRVLVAILRELVGGRTAINKHFAPVAWQYSNAFIDAMLTGYLEGDGHNDAGNARWRLGFCRNYSLERDLRTACARLGYTLTLNMSRVKYNGSYTPTFRGEIRKTRSGHHNERSRSEVVEVRRSRCRYVYDIGVEDNPHTFALASGVLTHNSKPNPMPESCTDRPTKSHEYIFLLSKRGKYYYDADAIREPQVDPLRSGNSGRGFVYADDMDNSAERKAESYDREYNPLGRNKRDVWTIPTYAFPGAHYATFPPKLIEPCILAGCPEGGTVLDCFSGSGTTGLVSLRHNRNFIGIELNPKDVIASRLRIEDDAPLLNTGSQNATD